jgi:ribonuclease HI
VEHITSVKDRQIVIFSDSEAALNALRSRNTSSSLVAECKFLAIKVSKLRKLSLIWIKGHADATGNELADMLAKKGTIPTCGVEPFLPVTRNACKAIIKIHVEDMWRDKWQSFTKYNHTRKFIREVNIDRSYKKFIMSYSRPRLKLLVEWISGHRPLKKHLVDIHRGTDSLCRLCKESQETPFHVTLQCEFTERKRIEIHRVSEIDENWNILNWKSRRKRWEIDRIQPTPELINLIEIINDLTKAELTTDYD